MAFRWIKRAVHPGPWTLGLLLLGGASVGTAALLSDAGGEAGPSASVEAERSGVPYAPGKAEDLVLRPEPSASSVGGRPADGPRLQGGKPRARARASRPARSEAVTLALLRKARGWTQHLEAWLSLPPASGPQQRRERVDKVLAGLTDPVVRQNVIFLAALTQPWEEARPWLEGLRRGADAADAEDALCALAFSGDAGAVAEFQALARAPSGALVHRLIDDMEDHDALAAEGTQAARDVLRSYRAIEVLDRRPYFKIVAYHATRTWDGDAEERLAWRTNAVAPAPREALLAAWLARYPGHPGSDNMAVRLGHLRAQAGDAVGAAEWFARALALPDQAEARRAAGPLMVLCETILSPAELLRLAGGAGGDAPSRSVFLYAHVRRVAAGTGFEPACRALEDLTAHEPSLLLSVAWRNRWADDPCVGLQSGLAPLPTGDPLLRTEPERAAWPPARRWHEDGRIVPVGIWSGSWEAQDRLGPVADPGVLDRERLVRQLRGWDTLAELERRTTAASGTAEADLLYKQAAVFYHHRNLLFPCYEEHTFSFRSELLYSNPMKGADAEKEASDRLRLERYASESFAWERALALFQRLEREHPSYPGMDQVLFSEGLCWRRLVDYRPRGGWSGWYLPDEDLEDPGVAAARRCVEAFDRVSREHPTSPLADDAQRAAAWWRRAHPDALR